MSILSKMTRNFIDRRFPSLSSRKRSIPLEMNEALNVEKEVIFIAIPKTGTTSVRTQLGAPRSPIIENPHLDIRQVRDLIYVMLLRSTLGGNRTFPCETFPTDSDLRTRADEMFSSFFKFSAVRNPWARAVSLWSRREGVETKDSTSFEDFISRHHHASDTCRQPTRHVTQFDWLCDENGRMLMDYVYKVEEFDTAASEIRERTGGRLALGTRQLRVNPRSVSRTYRDIYTDTTRRIVAQRFEKDIDTFGYTF